MRYKTEAQFRQTLDKQKYLTKQECINIYKEFDADFDLNDFHSQDLHYQDAENDRYKITSEVKKVGGEGQGEEYYVISEILHKETSEISYIMFRGYYTSWDGVEWRDCAPVMAHEVSVIQFY